MKRGFTGKTCKASHSFTLIDSKFMFYYYFLCVFFLRPTVSFISEIHSTQHIVYLT